MNKELSPRINRGRIHRAIAFAIAPVVIAGLVACSGVRAREVTIYTGATPTPSAAAGTPRPETTGVEPDGKGAYQDYLEQYQKETERFHAEQLRKAQEQQAATAAPTPTPTPPEEEPTPVPIVTKVPTPTPTMVPPTPTRTPRPTPAPTPRPPVEAPPAFSCRTDYFAPGEHPMLPTGAILIGSGTVLNDRSYPPNSGIVQILLAKQPVIINVGANSAGVEHCNGLSGRDLANRKKQQIWNEAGPEIRDVTIIEVPSTP